MAAVSACIGPGVLAAAAAAAAAIFERLLVTTQVVSLSQVVAEAVLTIRVIRLEVMEEIHVHRTYRIRATYRWVS